MRLALFKLAVSTGVLLAAVAIAVFNYCKLIAQLYFYLFAVGCAYTVLQHFVFHKLPGIL